MFSEYGQKDPLGTFCTEEDISMEHIESLALEKLENFQEVDTVFLSLDLYEKMAQYFLGSMRYSAPQLSPSGHQVLRVVTSAGSLEIKRVPTLYNFCYVGTETSLKRLEWVKIDQEFEKIFFGEDT